MCSQVNPISNDFFVGVPVSIPIVQSRGRLSEDNFAVDVKDNRRVIRRQVRAGFNAHISVWDIFDYEEVQKIWNFIWVRWPVSRFSV